MTAERRARRRVMLLGSVVFGCGLWPHGPAGAQVVASSPTQAKRQWVMDTNDNGQAPFIIIDKRQARLSLFSSAGAEMGDTPVLLGMAKGDDSVPGIGERAMKDIRPHERTTPAGRFIAEAGRNADGEDIFWIDYDAAVSMHRVRANRASERRLQRLATPTPADNRISYGCINVPVAFYNERIGPTLNHQPAVVYVLPEMLPAPASVPAHKKAPS